MLFDATEARKALHMILPLTADFLLVHPGMGVNHRQVPLLLCQGPQGLEQGGGGGQGGSHDLPEESPKHLMLPCGACLSLLAQAQLCSHSPQQELPWLGLPEGKCGLLCHAWTHKRCSSLTPQELEQKGELEDGDPLNNFFKKIFAQVRGWGRWLCSDNV